MIRFQNRTDEEIENIIEEMNYEPSTSEESYLLNDAE